MNKSIIDKPTVKNLGQQPYLATYHAMHNFNQSRNENTTDEIWFVEHPAVFTQGKTGKPEHLLRHTTIPVIQTDRGGQITYHALGQQIMYILLDITKRKMSIRDIVSVLESSVIQTLAFYSIRAYSQKKAPGVYIENKKICSLGLQINRGCTLHGLALNVDMDLTPFNDINPCGYAGLQMTDLKAYLTDIDRGKIREKLAYYFIKQLD